MAEDNIQQLVNRLVEDEELLARFRGDPIVVVEEHGIDLDEEHRGRLRDEDWDEISDEELRKRLRGEDAGFWF